MHSHFVEFVTIIIGLLTKKTAGDTSAATCHKIIKHFYFVEYHNCVDSISTNTESLREECSSINQGSMPKCFEEKKWFGAKLTLCLLRARNPAAFVRRLFCPICKQVAPCNQCQGGSCGNKKTVEVAHTIPAQPSEIDLKLGINVKPRPLRRQRPDKRDESPIRASLPNERFEKYERSNPSEKFERNEKFRGANDDLANLFQDDSLASLFQESPFERSAKYERSNPAERFEKKERFGNPNIKIEGEIDPLKLIESNKTPRHPKTYDIGDG